MILRRGTNQFKILLSQSYYPDQLNFNLSSESLRAAKSMEHQMSADRRLHFGNLQASLHFLQSFRQDPMNLMSLRHIYKQAHFASYIHRMDDNEVIVQIAQMLVSGQAQIIFSGTLSAKSGKYRSTSGSSARISDVPMPLKPASPPARRSAAPPKASPRPEPELVIVAQEVQPATSPFVLAQAAALKQAAAAGSPFCEKCEEAAKEHTA